MRSLPLFILAFFIIQQVRAQDKDEVAIRKILSDQTVAWNAGNLRRIHERVLEQRLFNVYW